jgi:hypothetical protein
LDIFLILYLLSFCVSYVFTASVRTTLKPNPNLRHIVNPGYELSEHDDYDVSFDEMMGYPYEHEEEMINEIDTLSSEPLLPPRSSPACNNPQHSDFTTSWWWKLGKDLLAVALKRLLLNDNSAFAGLSSDTPKEPMMETPDYFDADHIGHDEEIMPIEKPKKKKPSYKWKKVKKQKKKGKKTAQYNNNYRE